MDELLLATIISVLTVAGIAGLIYLSKWNVPVTAGIAFLLLIASLLLADIFPFFLAIAVCIIVGSLVAIFFRLIAAIFFVPNVSSAMGTGWIKIWPQVIARRKINKAVLDHARAITGMNLPLAEGFFLAGQQTPDRSGVVLQAMATFLHQGLKLSEAYDRYKARSALLLSMIQVGERCGQLPHVLEYMQDYYDRERQQRQRWIPVWWPYPVIMLAAVALIVTFMMAFVVPKYAEIFKDFDTTLPTVTKVLIRVPHVVAKMFWLIWLCLSVIAGIIVYFRLQPRRYPKPRLSERFADRVVWMISGLRAKREYTDLAHTAAVLRLSLGAGMNMPEAVKCAADLDLHIVLRRQFEQFQTLLAQGEPTDQAGQKVNLPPRFLWALRNGQNRETLQSSLELIEKYYGLVASHWNMTLNAMIWPVIVVGLGLLIGFIDLCSFYHW